MLHLLLIMSMMVCGFTQQFAHYHSMQPYHTSFTYSQPDYLQQSMTTNPTTMLPHTDWQTYANTDYNFTFQYPSDWKIGTYPSGQGVTHIALDPKRVGTEVEYKLADAVMGMITFTLSEDNSEVFGGGSLASIQLGADGIQSYVEPSEASGVVSYYIPLPETHRKNGFASIAVEVHGYEASVEDHVRVNQILKTLRFTN